jgi:predicted aspartyl protease
MLTYEANWFNPPAPLASIILHNQKNGITLSDVLMMIDTGADVTLVPQSAVDRLGISIDPEHGYELMGVDGRISVAKVVELDMVFLRRVFRGRFLIIDREVSILGRDILNYMSLLLDRPGLSWNEQKPPQT